MFLAVRARSILRPMVGGPTCDQYKEQGGLRKVIADTGHSPAFEPDEFMAALGKLLK
jgi:hypothetical protein